MGLMEMIIVVIGCISGYYFRDTQAKNGKIVGVLIGLIGAIAISLVFTIYLFKPLYLIPFYAVFGSWLFNFVWNKIKK